MFRNGNIGEAWSVSFIAYHVIQSLLHKEETSLIFMGKEVDLARSLFDKQPDFQGCLQQYFIRSQKNTSEL